MRVKDESQWQQQLAEFAADDDPMSATMEQFLVYWCELAEKTIDQLKVSPIKALRYTLRATEEATTRPLVGFLGMALVVICTHWEPAGEPQEFFNSMTQIEQNLFTDVAALKVADMERVAQEFLSGEQP